MSRYRESTNRDKDAELRSSDEERFGERSDYYGVTRYTAGRESTREFPRRSTAFGQRYGMDYQPRYESRREAGNRYIPYEATNLHDSVYFACAEFEGKTGIEVSRSTRSLIQVVLEAIVLDPHPRWRVSEDYRRITVGKFVADLPRILQRVSRQERVRGMITSFDVLHYLSVELDGLCLFK